MANGVVSASRLGQINASGGTNELFLKVFANEILTAFDEANVMKDLHTIRTISSGKSAQFPVTGIATAKYHTVGEDILEEDTGGGYTSNIKHAEKIINIDDVLLAASFIANIDEMKNHYDVRSIYSKELGKALAKRFDLATMKTLFAAAGSDGTADNPNGIILEAAGTDVSGSSPCAGVSTAANIISTITTMAQKLDENDVPSDDRFIILTPESYYKLMAADSAAINRDFNGGRGDLTSAPAPQVAGIDIVKSNHLADVIALGNDSGGATDDQNSANDVHPSGNAGSRTEGGGGVGYDGNYTGLLALGGHKSAIGTVKLMDLTTESEYVMTKQGTALVAKYAMGHGVLRPECAVKVVA